MTYRRAITTIDHHQARIICLNAETHTVRNIRLHSHATGKHASAVRDEHEFFASVATGLNDLGEILITGHKTGISDFRHYVEKHRPALSDVIVAYEVIDDLTDRQLVAYARDFFDKHERLAHS